MQVKKADVAFSKGLIQSMQPIEAEKSMSEVSSKKFITFLLDSMGKGEFEVNSHYSVRIPYKIIATVSSSKNKLDISLDSSTSIFLRLKWLGFRYDAKIQGLSLTKETLSIKLVGVPDVVLKIE